MNKTKKILDLDKTIQEKAPKIYRKIPRFAINYLNKKVHVDELNHILTIYEDKDGVDFMTAVVGYFNLNLEVHGLGNISKAGRYIFASNHPLGGLDGICLSAIIGEIFDKKIKYPVNDILYYIPNLKSIFIPINKHGEQNRKLANEINEAFDSDNQIITFPAGLCSRKQNGQIYDLEWKKSFIQKAIQSKRDIVPVHFKAENSKFFYRFANLRRWLGLKFNIEMLYLPNEMMKKKNSTFVIIIGEPISYTTFDSSKNYAEWANYIKQTTYKLG